MPRAKNVVGDVYDGNSLTPYASHVLMAAYLVDEGSETPSTAAVSEWLDATQPGAYPPNALNQFLKKLQDAGLVDQGAKRAIEFTRKGKREAEGVIRRYRLAERMVVDIFKMSLHRAPNEARSLFHSISPELETCIDETLGHPSTSPFGYPIPASSPGQRDAVKRTGVKRLPDCDTGDEVEVYQIPVNNETFLLHLIEKEIIPGNKITVTEADDLSGIISFTKDDRIIVMSSQVSSSIWVADPIAEESLAGVGDAERDGRLEEVA